MNNPAPQLNTNHRNIVSLDLYDIKIDIGTQIKTVTNISMTGIHISM